MHIFDRFLEICRPSASPVVLECGVCDAVDSLQMATILFTLYRPFEFHGFEAKTKHWCCFEKMRQLADQRPDSRVVFVPKAIGQVDGKVPFWVSGDSHPNSSSIRKPKLALKHWPTMTFEESTVESVRLDTYVATEGLEGRTIDFMWADIQGAEVDLIKGGLLTFKNIRYFYTEFDHTEHYEGQINLDTILELLPDFEVVENYGGDVLLGNKLYRGLESL